MCPSTCARNDANWFAELEIASAEVIGYDRLTCYWVVKFNNAVFSIEQDADLDSVETL